MKLKLELVGDEVGQSVKRELDVDLDTYDNVIEIVESMVDTLRKSNQPL